MILNDLNFITATQMPTPPHNIWTKTVGGGAGVGTIAVSALLLGRLLYCCNRKEGFKPSSKDSVIVLYDVGIVRSIGNKR